MAKRKTELEHLPEPPSKETTTIMSRKEFPIILTLTDGSIVKLTKGKPVVVKTEQLPPKLPAGVLSY